MDNCLRLKKDGSVFLTDNGNYILDISLKEKILKDVRKMHFELKSICGVLETGLFFDLDPVLFVAEEKGVIRL